MDPELDVFDFVVVDGAHDSSAAAIIRVAEGEFEFGSVIEVCAFEDEGESGDVFEFGLKVECFGPDPAIDGLIAEVESEFAGALDMKSCVTLFVEHDFGKSTAEVSGGSGECEEDAGHDFERLKFVVGHDVMRDGAFGGIAESIRAGHGRRGPAFGELERVRTSWGGDAEGRVRVLVCE